MGGSEGQTYCLRWNNHKSNLVEILHALINQDKYTDCTIYVDDNVKFKAHRVILAANSPYFQSILQDIPMEHCVIIFPEVRPFEMKALIEYMYTGEVNVTQSQIPRIMKIAEQLEVKGLFDMNDLKDKFDKIKMEEGQHFAPNLNTQANNNKMHNNQQSSPIITTSTNISSAQSSSSSPPYNYKSHYPNIFPRSPVPSSSDCPPSQWSMSAAAAAAAAAHHLTSPISTPTQFQNAAAALSSVYESGSDMNPLKRKKLSSISSMLMTRDTPILRNVLAQPAPVDSSQHGSMVCTSGNNDRSDRSDRSDRQSTHSNGTDYSDKKIKYEEPHSPYNEKFDDEDNGLNYSGSDSRIAGYSPHGNQQKPEWKRYKQYTRNDITLAIECVRNGMSALQASRLYKVPSRTLYDKVKKLGITAGRPMNRTIKRSPSNNGSPAAFPYGISGTRSPYPHNLDNQSHSQAHNESENGNDGLGRKGHLSSTMPHPAAGLLDATFLQHALEARGGDIAGRDALHAMAMVAVAQAAVNGMSTSPGTHGTARSPSPSVMVKYMRPQSPNGDLDENNHHVQSSLAAHSQLLAVPHPGRVPSRTDVHSVDGNDDDEDEDDHVEDLSISKKEPAPQPRSPSPRSPSPPAQPVQPPQLGVIVPPMTAKIAQNNKDENNITVNIKHEIAIDDN